jgi:FMN-dependent NADH-azoreductase
MHNKKVIIAIASGGTKVGSEMDFASRYLIFIFGFIGIKDVTIVDINKTDLKKNDAFLKIQLQELI